MRFLLKLRVNGHRGAFQLLMGGVYSIIGMTSILRENPPHSMQWIDPVPYFVVGLPWLFTGFLAIMSSFYPRPKDWLSFAALAFTAALSGSLYMFSFALGYSETISGAAVYYLIAGMVMVVSGMQGPSDKDHRRIEIL